MKEQDAKKLADAQKQLAEWLSDERELGARPSKIEYVESFVDEDEISCMIFKYKKSLFSKWMLGIVSDSGVFSQMQEFRQETAVQDAKACLEFLKNYWKNLAAKQAGTENAEYAKRKGAFSGFVLLAQKSWDKESFKKEFEEAWGLKPAYDEGDDTEKKDGDNCDALIMELGSQRVMIGYMGIPVPGGEVEQNAAFNYTWKEAVEVTKTHQAQLVVAIMGAHEDVKQDGELFVKVVSVLCRQKGALGVYANGVVYQPEFYFAMREFIEKGIFPLMGLVWFGIMGAEHGYHVYTIGMNCFGKDDMEILGTLENPGEVKKFLTDIAGYCIDQDVVLHDGETIGLTAQQRCKLTRSPGVTAGGMTIKIAYEK